MEKQDAHRFLERFRTRIFFMEFGYVHDRYPGFAFLVYGSLWAWVWVWV